MVSEIFEKKYPPLKEGDGHYSFTFVRNPLVRFISGYTEIEVRIPQFQRTLNSVRNACIGVNQSNPINTTSWKCLRVGSVERLEAYILSLLAANGTRHILLADMFFNDHIMPQVGTLITAVDLFHTSLRVFHLESFDEDWEQVLYESGLEDCISKCVVEKGEVRQEWSCSQPTQPTSVVQDKGFVGLRRLVQTSGVGEPKNNPIVSPGGPPVNSAHRQKKTSSSKSSSNTTDKYRAYKGHVSSSDPLGTTAMANAYLFGAMNMNMTARNRAYLRVLCRLYLPDFLCLGYALPVECRDLYDEVDRFLLQRVLKGMRSAIVQKKTKTMKKTTTTTKTDRKAKRAGHLAAAVGVGHKD